MTFCRDIKLRHCVVTLRTSIGRGVYILRLLRCRYLPSD